MSYWNYFAKQVTFNPGKKLPLKNCLLRNVFNFEDFCPYLRLPGNASFSLFPFHFGLGGKDSEQGWWKHYGKGQPYPQEKTLTPILNRIAILRLSVHK